MKIFSVRAEIDNMTHLSFICLTALVLAVSAKKIGKVQDSQLLHDANNKFTSRMFDEVAHANEGKSFVMSAFSVMPVLGQLALASTDKSHDELLHTLDIPNDMIVEVFSYSNELIQSVKDVTLNIAEKIYIANNYKINKNFSEISRNAFHSEVQNIDFHNNQAAANEINQWVEAHTSNKITNLIDANSITDDTRAILVNAIYFKGNWKHPFSVYRTKETDFHVTKNKVNKVQIMHRTGYYKYAESSNLNAQMLEIPYEGDQLSFVVILPHEIDGLQALEEKLRDPSALDKALSAMSNVEVDVYLPKFKIETKIELKDVLQQMGINEIFTPGENRLNNLLEGENDLYIDTAIQKAFVEVNEEGTEAAAANVYEIVVTKDVIISNPSAVFKADRPFYFVIRTNSESLLNGVMHGN